jgi:LysM repeat protein
MSLPSQSARAVTPGRTYMAHKSRRNLKPLFGAGAAVLILGLAGWAFTRGGPRQADASPTNPGNPSAASGQTVTTRSPSPPPPSTAAEGRLLASDRPKADAPPPIFELRQGRNQPSAQPASLESQPRASEGILASPLATPPPSSSPSAPASTLREPAPAPASYSGSLPADLAASLTAAQQKHVAGDLVAARALFSRVLADGRTPEPDRATLRQTLAAINDDLVFSPRLAPADPFVTTYTVESGDSIIRIAQKLKTPPDYRLLIRINRTSPQSLKTGQRLKVITAPFHAVVSKSAYRLDLWLGPADQPEQWVFVRSFPVGLGEGGSTPTGTFVVKKGSKLQNPPWTNPRTGEHFGGHDPKNPIGKFWIGLEGTGDSAAFTGYGLHGTIDPGSIGQQRSMGCVRMGEADIALMFELMGESLSTVRITP